MIHLMVERGGLEAVESRDKEETEDRRAKAEGPGRHLVDEKMEGISRGDE